MTYVANNCIGKFRMEVVKLLGLFIKGTVDTKTLNADGSTTSDRPPTIDIHFLFS